MLQNNPRYRAPYGSQEYRTAIGNAKPYNRVNYEQRGYSPAPEGKTWCPKHPTTFYDARRYDKCYRCYMEEKGGSQNGR